MNKLFIFLLRFLMFLFTVLFIYPAITFSVLVVGLTSSWEPGISMLASALLLLILIKLYSINILIGENERNDCLETSEINDIPPPLSEIYLQINSRNWEQELVAEKCIEQEDIRK